MKKKIDKVDTIKKRVAKTKLNWLEAFKKKWTIAGACLAVGITRSAYYLWTKKDPEFVGQQKEIEEEQIDFTESKLYEAINQGNLTAVIFYLKNRRRQKWGAEERRKWEGEIKAEFQLNDDQFQQIIKYYRGKERHRN